MLPGFDPAEVWRLVAQGEIDTLMGVPTVYARLLQEWESLPTLERLRCARAAGWLAAAGVERGDRVALLLANRSATLELVLGAARLGAIAVPLNTRLAPPEIAQLLDHCTPRHDHVVTTSVELYHFEL